MCTVIRHDSRRRGTLSLLPDSHCLPDQGDQPLGTTTNVCLPGKTPESAGYRAALGRMWYQCGCTQLPPATTTSPELNRETLNWLHTGPRMLHTVITRQHLDLEPASHHFPRKDFLFRARTGTESKLCAATHHPLALSRMISRCQVLATSSRSDPRAGASRSLKLGG